MFEEGMLMEFAKLNLVCGHVFCGHRRRISRNRRPVSRFVASPHRLQLRRQLSPVSLAKGPSTQISSAPAFATGRSLLPRTKDNLTKCNNTSFILIEGTVNDEEDHESHLEWLCSPTDFIFFPNKFVDEPQHVISSIHSLKERVG
ncbi:hypothetical protein NECAME_17752 [Necator americanus]|uniref:Uncharacterized protein n=1 Tax=Necator americanus TaxID=51031 RepID=W2TMV2_NECAM|nr:hypothetical protein NECAME_17752 [Necator americanus]ETN82317.1 hypothetical protein NECAME_17752 [Necator americanus]